MAGLYVHIPFCRRRCSYCDFYFVTGSREKDRFVEAVVLEIASIPDRYRREDVDTVYFGGGTPSQLTGDQLDRILSALNDHFSISDDAERTIEINPEDSDPDYLSGLSQLRFNRLSIGIQSFSPADLRFMRRAHTADQGRDVIDASRRAGFQQLSVDLIFGLPGQRVGDWMAGLDFVVERKVPHVSTYGLTVEPRTLLAKWIADGRKLEPDDDLMAEMYVATIDTLSSAGYRHYEISSFATPGSQSRHNNAYWRHANYLGFGPSAHSFWWDTEAVRWSNVRSLRRYIDVPRRHVLNSLEVLDRGQLALERVMLGLRTSSGVSRDELRDRYGSEFSVLGEERILELERNGMMTSTTTTISLTPSGRLVLNAVIRQLCDSAALGPADVRYGGPEAAGT